MSIKTGLFSFLFSVVLLLRYSHIIDHCCIMENDGKSRKNKNKLRTILKTMKILRTASLGSNFTGSYKKKSVLSHFVALLSPA